MSPERGRPPSSDTQARTHVTLKAGLLADLATAGLAPIHRLGQNFMIDPQAVAALVEAIAAPVGSRVLEIGPGTGILTRALLAAGHSVLALELDRGLAAWLETGLANTRCHIVHGDALERKNALHPAIVAWVPLGPWYFAANLPYSISIPAILNAIALAQPPERIAVTIQYEAAERLCAQPGSKAWGASAAVAQAAGDGHILRRLAPGSFHPRPRVASAIWCWEPRRPLPPGFAPWCRQLFAYRRRFCVRALREAGMARDQAASALDALGIAHDIRWEALAVEQLLALYARLAVGSSSEETI